MLSVDDGLTLSGRAEKPKLMVIIGCDASRSVYYGALLINTRQNPRARYSAEFWAAQHQLHQADYPDFLRYDSFVDCAQIFPIPVERLLHGSYFGTLTETDLNAILAVLCATETIPPKEKRRFGIT